MKVYGEILNFAKDTVIFYPLNACTKVKEKNSNEHE